MEIQFEPDLQAKLDQLARDSGRSAEDLVQDALAGYFDEWAETRQQLDSRYDDIKNGKAKLIDGEEAFARLHARIDERPSGTARGAATRFILSVRRHRRNSGLHRPG